MNELGIKDVMIGCHVDFRVKVAPDNPHYEKITPAHFMRDEIWYGIPLKRIHLTKNGFKPTNEYDDVFVFNDGYKVSVEFCKGLPAYNIEPYIYLKIEFAEKELIIQIKYLHELEIAMRLFGVEKEIEL